MSERITERKNEIYKELSKEKRENSLLSIIDISESRVVEIST